MVGAWNFAEMTPCALPEKAATAFSGALDGMAGVDYTPVLYVGSQLVAGTNYCIVCKTTTVTNPPQAGCKIVFIYADLNGNYSVTKIEDVIG